MKKRVLFDYRNKWKTRKEWLHDVYGAKYGVYFKLNPTEVHAIFFDRKDAEEYVNAINPNELIICELIWPDDNLDEEEK
jgi:hypothetical protein